MGMPSARIVTRPKRALGVQGLLEWAFAVEHARIETDPGRQLTGAALPGFGMEYVLIERMKLGGVRIDTSRGGSEPHEDAEVVAAILERLPSEHGGLGMAIRVAELARARITPDWLPGAVPKCEPAEWRQTPRGPRAVEHVVETITHRHRGRKVKREVTACAVIYRPTPAQIAAARRGYAEWWKALLYLSTALRCAPLRDHEVTDALPPPAPWMRRGVDEPLSR